MGGRPDTTPRGVALRFATMNSAGDDPIRAAPVTRRPELDGGPGRYRIGPVALSNDHVIDIHSGGKTMMFSPFACYHRILDAAAMEQAKQAMLAFAAPISLELVELDPQGMLDTAVEEMGKIFVGCELGGGGTTTTHTVSIAEIGVRNLLAHFEIIAARPRSREDRGLLPTRRMHMPDAACFVIGDDAGIYEALMDLDSPVRSGDAVGQVHFPEQPQRAPVVYRAARAGTLIGRTHKALVGRGDSLALIAADT